MFAHSWAERERVGDDEERQLADERRTLHVGNEVGRRHEAAVGEDAVG